MRVPTLVASLIVTYDPSEAIDACLDGALAQAADDLDAALSPPVARRGRRR